MSAPVEIVRRHIAAFARYDWPALTNSVSEGVQLLLVGTVDWDWTLPNLYRQVTQAWDYTPGDTQLHDQGGGTVRAKIRLMNGGDTKVVKDIEGEYHVSGDRIDAITLTDSVPFRVDDTV